MAVKILLVDDSKSVGDSIRKIVQPRGYLLFEATDVENAVSMLANETFDLILLDITLPEKAGFRVLEFLKEKHLSGKVIVITGTVAIEHAIKSTTLEDWDFIAKPYNPDFLMQFIDMVIADQTGTNHKLHIIKAGDFIKSTPKEDLDMVSSKQGFAQIAAAGAHLNEFNVLIDLREVKSRLSIDEIYHLATDLFKYGETFHRKTALLTRDHDDLSKAALFETAAQERGFNVKAFTVFEKAVLWLSTISRVTGFPIT